MTAILGIETATEVCSVAIFTEERTIAERKSENPFEHTTLLTTLIGEVLADAGISIGQLSAVAISLGPGSYTGLRVGLSTAKGICYAGQLPLIGLSTLEALAFGSIERSQTGKTDAIIPAIDARRSEIYTALFDPDGRMIREPFSLVLTDAALGELIRPYDRIRFVGNGVHKIQIDDRSKDIELQGIDCSATFLRLPSFSKYRDGLYGDIAYCEPMYLKPPHITRPRKTLL